MADEFGQFSDVGRVNCPYFHSPVDDLEMQHDENHRLKSSVCPLDEVCEPEGAEYSYAYYEPGPPTSRANFVVNNANANPHTERNSRHTYVTRYGTEENIYEEITEVAAKCSRLAEQEDRVHHHRRQQQHSDTHQSQLSLNQSVLEEEVRRVQSRHRRVLGELNLAVEAMLMPPPPPKDEQTTDDKGSGPPFLLEDLLLSVGPTDELLSPASCNIGDHDSGFSGSSGTSYGFSGSSGASVLSGNSLGRHAREKSSGSSQSFPRTAGANVPVGATSAHVYSPLLHRHTVKSGAGCLRLSRTREPANSCKAQHQNKQNQQQQNHHHGFFGRKGWIRLPGFGSSQPNKGKSQLVILCVHATH